MHQQSLYDPGAVQLREDPYPIYRRLLREEPLYRLPKGILSTPAANEWLVSSHEFVSFALKDSRFIREVRKLYPPQEGAAPPPFMQKYMAGMGGMMLFRDPPHHTRLRSLVNKAFSPVHVESLRPRIVETAQHLLRQTAELEEFDLVREFALPLPVIVIGEMLGVPFRMAAHSQALRRQAAAGNSLFVRLRCQPASTSLMIASRLRSES